MSKRSLAPELSEEQLDELLAYAPAFSEQNLANIKAHSFAKIEQKEKDIMKKSKVGRLSMVAVVLTVMILTTSAFAAWHFLRPSEVIDLTGDSALSAAFESGNAININQSITSGEHIFTLLAVASGEDITAHPIYSSGGGILSDRTYAVLAIQNTDGSPMPSPDDDAYEPFMVSPFVRGINPWQANIFTMDGGQHAMVVDGILYIVIDFNDVTMFADRGVYLGVNAGGFSAFALMDAFMFNEQTGEITVNPYASRTTVIFEIPFDPSLADPERAQQFLNNNLFSMQSDDVGGVVSEESPQLNLQRMDYEALKAWTEEEMERLRASGNYSSSVLALFEQDHIRMLDAVRDGFYFYMSEDGSFWQAINPAYADSGIGFHPSP